MVIGIIYLSVEFFFPREGYVTVSLAEQSEAQKLEKIQRGDQYFISFTDSNKKVEVKCTKKQYEHIEKDRIYYILYRVNFFRRSKGTILELSDNPLWLH